MLRNVHIANKNLFEFCAYLDFVTVKRWKGHFGNRYTQEPKQDSDTIGYDYL